MLLLIGALWFGTRQYQGVVYDARFYMVQALHVLDPAHFARDPYFRFGSQDEYSIFSNLYAPIVSRLGVGAAAIVGTIAGQLLWVCGLVYLATGVIGSRRLALLSAATAIALPSTYAFFGYGEPFVTPRLFAEALSLAALGFLVRGRTGRALLILACSMAIHPLMTLPALGFALIYLAQAKLRWCLAILAAITLAVALSLAGLQPFANLRARFDPIWFEIVKMRMSFCFITRWTIDSYFRVLSIIALATLAMVSAAPGDRRLLGSALVIGMGGLAATFIGADLAHNVFAAEIQPWRSMWLLTLTAQLYAVPVLVGLYRGGQTADMTRLAFLTALGCLLLSSALPPIIFVAAPMMAAAALLAIWQHLTGRPLPQLGRALALLAIALAWAQTCWISYEFVIFLQPWPENIGHRLYSFGLVISALALMILLVKQPGSRSQPQARVLACLAAALLALALLEWDARTPWTRWVEGSGSIPALAALLPQNASVYWEGGMELLWLRLRRPSYFSCDQGTGALFFRDIAVDFQRSRTGFWPLRTLDFGRSALCPLLTKTKNLNRTRADLEAVCRDEPGLDEMVLTRPVQNMKAKIWDAPAPYQDVNILSGQLLINNLSRFYIYSCKAARHRLPDTVPRPARG